MLLVASLLAGCFFTPQRKVKRNTKYISEKQRYNMDMCNAPSDTNDSTREMPDLRNGSDTSCTKCHILIQVQFNYLKKLSSWQMYLTSVVTRQKPVKEIRLYGKVQADERLLQSQVAHIPGTYRKTVCEF